MEDNVPRKADFVGNTNTPNTNIPLPEVVSAPSPEERITNLSDISKKERLVRRKKGKFAKLARRMSRK